MFSFKQFLNEQSLPTTDEEIAELIKQDCSEYLRVMPNCGLWRGLSTSNNAAKIQIKTVRKDREPLTSSREMHEALDKIFSQHTGIKFRSQSLFVSPSILEAELYGRAFLIFPIGKIDYCWSPDIKDLFSPSYMFPKENTMMAKYMTEVINKEFPDRIKTQKAADIFFELGTGAKNTVLIKTIAENFDSLYNFNKDLSKNNDIFKGNEVMISCDKYYIIEKSIARKVLSLIL